MGSIISTTTDGRYHTPRSGNRLSTAPATFAGTPVRVQVNKVLGVRTPLANSYESLVVPGRVNTNRRWTMGLVYDKK
jgi:hypothetical protein